MNRKDQEQVELYRRYLLERADRSRSRLVRDQVRRWVEWVDGVEEREREERRSMNEDIDRMKAA